LAHFYPKPSLIGTRFNRVRRLLQAYLDFRRTHDAPLRFLDVGALFGLQKRWAYMHRLGAIEPILVEPDAAEAARLRTQYPGAFIIEAALGARKGEATLRMTRDQGKSSLLEPDLANIAKFEPIDDWQVVREVPIQVDRLDDLLAGKPAPDFMKIDVQGYELEVLKGAEATLRDTLALEVEASSVPLYLGQPDVSELTRWLLDRGFACIAVKTTGTFGGEGINAVEFDCFFVNRRLAEQRGDAVAIWRTINRIRTAGGWDMY
jgi:FkbM family methyltransferase